MIGTLALLVLAYGGYRLYQDSRQQHPTTVTPSGQSVNPPASQPTEASGSASLTEASVSAQPEGKYFTVPELDIRFPADSLTGLSYQVVNRDGTTSIELVSAELTGFARDRDPGNFCGSPGSVGVLTKSDQEIPNPNATETQSGFLTELGGSYYYLTYVQNQCSENEEVMQEQNRLLQAVYQSVRRMELTR